MVSIPSVLGDEYGHTLVRYKGDVEDLNIETTAQGRLFHRLRYERDFGTQLKTSPKSFETELTGKKAVASLARELCILNIRNEGSFEKARTLIEKACLLWPDCPLFLSEMGIVLIGAGEMERGFELLEKSCGLHPSDFNSNFKMFACCVDFGRHEKAVEVARRYLSANLEHPFSYLIRLGLYYVEALPESPAESCMKSPEAIRKAQEFVDTYRAKHSTRLYQDEEKWLKSLPALLKQRLQESQE
jgi:hypothetical protein